MSPQTRLKRLTRIRARIDRLLSTNPKLGEGMQRRHDLERLFAQANVLNPSYAPFPDFVMAEERKKPKAQLSLMEGGETDS